MQGGVNAEIAAIAESPGLATSRVDTRFERPPKAAGDGAAYVFKTRRLCVLRVKRAAGVRNRQGSRYERKTLSSSYGVVTSS